MVDVLLEEGLQVVLERAQWHPLRGLMAPDELLAGVKPVELLGDGLRLRVEVRGDEALLNLAAASLAVAERVRAAGGEPEGRGWTNALVLLRRIRGRRIRELTREAANRQHLFAGRLRNEELPQAPVEREG